MINGIRIRLAHSYRRVASGSYFPTDILFAFLTASSTSFLSSPKSSAKFRISISHLRIYLSPAFLHIIYITNMYLYIFTYWSNSMTDALSKIGRTLLNSVPKNFSSSLAIALYTAFGSSQNFSDCNSWIVNTLLFIYKHLPFSLYLIRKFYRMNNFRRIIPYINNPAHNIPNPALSSAFLSSVFLRLLISLSLTVISAPPEVCLVRTDLPFVRAPVKIYVQPVIIIVAC